MKTLLYNFIRQERSPPPGTHVFQQQTDGGGLLYGIASGVASESDFLETIFQTLQSIAFMWPPWQTHLQPISVSASDTGVCAQCRKAVRRPGIVTAESPSRGVLGSEEIISAGQHRVKVALSPYFCFVETLRKPPKQPSSAPSDKSHASSYLKCCQKYFYVPVLFFMVTRWLWWPAVGLYLSRRLD